ncbi:uncharacterized protein ATC70_011947 [Mucor velutinosus]|uniref:BAG domain-containing protein n=1 Tax=Mucor velutinosus TaxID=708070 RepID=A0AAN7I4J7_9FUNG|nr:hypothetical protein ATC70_011947 [Mucor velutinosus]
MSTIVLSEDNLTLDDFLQLQSLLNHEQGECEKHIEACQQHQQQQQQQHHHKPHVHPVHHHHARPVKFRRAISSEAAHESQQEKQRLAQALLTLQYLKDQYRRQRAAEIQAYLNEYRRQALISSILREEEERYYRQCIAAALEQRRVNLLWQQFVEAKKQETLLQQLQKQELCEQLEQQQQEQVREEEEEEEEEEDEEEEEQDDDGYSEYHSQQLANLLKQIFAQQQQQQQKESDETMSPSPAPVPAANVNVNSKSKDDEQKSMAEVWKYLNEQKADSETPRNAFLSSEQDRVLGSGEASPHQEEQTVETNPQDEQQEAESIGSPASVLSDEDQIKALPPLQDHVVTLQDLIQKLAAEPVLVGEEYNKFDAPPAPSLSKDVPLKERTLPTPLDTGKATANDTAAAAAAAETADHGKDKKDVEEDKAEKPFLPQHIFTEAEPTPTLENMPNTPLDNASIKDESHFADTIAAEQQNQEIPADPRKDKANEELDHISDQLSHNSDLVQRWNSVLSHASNLSFSKQPEGTLLLTASTDANRQFLGSEDEIMRVMLKLDSIDSFGDDDIRQKRKKLVKKCEHMLEELDQVKKTQWEKVVSSNKQGHTNRRRRNKKKKHHRK